MDPAGAISHRPRLPQLGEKVLRYTHLPAPEGPRVHFKALSRGWEVLLDLSHPGNEEGCSTSTLERQGKRQGG